MSENSPVTTSSASIQTDNSHAGRDCAEAGRKSLFLRYRPTYHVIARKAFMNDPCGAAYVPETEEYLLCYQLGSTVDSFADAWGCCTSKDLIHWRDADNAIEPGAGEYDRLKVFSGSIYATRRNDQTILYLYYTSIRQLPIHWTQPYHVGCESQSLAVSSDLGKTWQRDERNPLLLEPTTGVRTTGWRDPFVSTWPDLSTLLGLPSSTIYMMLSSGTKDYGPQLILYKSTDLTGWTEIGPIFAPKAEGRFDDASGLNYGHNFECGSFFTLDGHQYLVFGVEGSQTSSRHASRWTMWLSGELQLTSPGKPVFVPSSMGTLDHDILYAMHLSRNRNGELIQYGWLDEDMNSLQRSQEWAGCHSLPRSVSTLTMPLSQNVTQRHNWIIDEASQTMTTLSIRPIGASKLLREGATVHHDNFSKVRSKCFEFSASFTTFEMTKIKFSFRISDNGAERTRVIVDLQEEKIILDRSETSKTNGSATDCLGHFQLLETTLNLSVFCDNSTVEVFANDRFCMSSRIYPDPSSLGMNLSFEGDEKALTKMKYEATIYEGLSSAWPHRQADA